MLSAMPETSVAIAKRRALTYLVLVILFSAVAYYFVFRFGLGKAVLFMMWCPALAAFATSLITGRKLREIGWKPGKMKYLLVGWLVPIAYATVAYVAVWITGIGGIPNPDYMQRIAVRFHMQGQSNALLALAAFVVIATVGTLFGLISATGEEIGWRGFWVPELTKWLGFRRAALFSGVFWALWHWPAILFTEYSSGTPRPYELACFTAMVISIAMLFAWVRLKSNSVWPCALLHASHNAIIQAFFDGITVDRGHTKYFTTEFGIALVIPTAVIAVWCWRHSAEVEPENRVAAAA
jgi:membrane protease YdiL (CAAX protease family)